MLKKTCAAGGVAIAATAGILLTGSPASAQGPTLVQGHHRGHHVRIVSTNRNHNRNVNLNRNKVIVRVRVHNRNNNMAVSGNRGGCCSDGFFRRDGFRRDGLGRDGFFRPSGFSLNRGCCGTFDDDFGRGRRGFGRGDRVRAGDVSVNLGRSDVFRGFGRDRLDD